MVPPRGGGTGIPAHTLARQQLMAVCLHVEGGPGAGPGEDDAEEL